MWITKVTSITLLFSEVRFKRKIESYQFNGESYKFLQPLMEAIFLNKVNEITNVSE